MPGWDPKPAPNAKQPKAKPAAAGSSFHVADGEHQAVRGMFTLFLFRSRRSQKTGGWLQCPEISACWYHAPHAMRMPACFQKPLATNSKQATGRELCAV